MEFNWQRVIYKDYTTMYIRVVAIILILNLEHAYLYELHNSH
jgi:hypothetical protein